jgi:hypothetical protein
MSTAALPIFPSHETISNTVEQIVGYHPIVPKFIKTFVMRNLNFDGMHNREGLDDIMHDLPSFADEMNCNVDNLLADLAKYVINIPTSDEYMAANEL